MKYIIGILIGMALAGGTVVYAKTITTQTLTVTDSTDIGFEKIYKIYDQNNNDVCYVIEGHNAQFGGISCLK